MKYLLPLLLLVACTDRGRPLKNAKLKAQHPEDMDCIETGGDYPTVFCVDDIQLIICDRERCIVYDPH